MVGLLGYPIPDEFENEGLGLATSLNSGRISSLRGNAIEAAEQCGILTLPEITMPCAFDKVIATRDPARLLVFCDEDADLKDPVAALAAARAPNASTARRWL